MYNGDSERKALPDAQRQVGSQLIEVGTETETPHKLGDARFRLVRRKPEKASVKVEILADRELRVERE